MGKVICALASGIVFGFGLGLSQMVNPEKVLGFLDVMGAWDPSLALVMIGAIGSAFFAFRLVPRWRKPIFEDGFKFSVDRSIDIRLIVGAALFGIGWGLVGFCPGPAVSSLVYGHIESLIFLVAMIGGIALAQYLTVTLENKNTS